MGLKCPTRYRVMQPHPRRIAKGGAALPGTTERLPLPTLGVLGLALASPTFLVLLLATFREDVTERIQKPWVLIVDASGDGKV